MPPPPPTLPDELLEEIFLRLPPDEPACLVRASLASKLWLGLLTSPAFRSRYGELHGAPPMLGFLLSYLDKEKHPAAPFFTPTAKFGAHIPDKSEWGLGQRRYESVDCRHGRVLLADACAGFRNLTVWDPMTDCRRVLHAPHGFIGLGAAVLCAVTGCNHHGCHQGPFRVLLFGLSISDGEQRCAHAWVWSSQTEEWTEPCSPLHLGCEDAFIQPKPSLFFQNGIYHKVSYPDHIAILKYDIGSNCMSLLDGPPLERLVTAISSILMVMEDDNLGFTYLDCFTICRWSTQIRSDEVATWTQHRIVDLKKLLPIQTPQNELRLIGFKEGSGIVFMSTDLGIYKINLKTLEWNKLCKKLWRRGKIHAFIPYMSFYNLPAIPPEEQAHRRKLAQGRHHGRAQS